MLLAINPLLSDKHFASGFEAPLRVLIGNLQHILAALDANKATILYDASIENKMFFDGSSFSHLIAGLNDSDLRRQWFIYTRNRATIAGGEASDAKIINSEVASPAYGAVHHEILPTGVAWISFCGCASVEESSIKVAIGPTLHHKGNAYDFESFAKWWPLYESSPKHGKITYSRAGGRVVSPMTINNNEAQKALMQSDEIGSRRFGRVGDIYIAFLKTHPDRNVYHGYEITREEYLAALAG